MQFRSSDTLPPGIDKEDILFIDIDPHQWYRLEADLDLGKTEKYVILSMSLRSSFNTCFIDSQSSFMAR